MKRSCGSSTTLRPQIHLGNSSLSHRTPPPSLWTPETLQLYKTSFVQQPARVAPRSFSKMTQVARRVAGYLFHPASWLSTRSRPGEPARRSVSPPSNARVSLHTNPARARHEPISRQPSSGLTLGACGTSEQYNQSEYQDSPADLHISIYHGVQNRGH